MTAEAVYRCNTCGIESKETTCFLRPYNKASPLLRTCVTCGQPPATTSHLRKISSIFWILFLPLFFLAGFKNKATVVFPKLLLATCLIQPLTLILHEFGHWLTARLLGLEVSLISFGAGPKVWTGKIFGTPLRIHGWPLSGRTYIGSRSMRFLRLRVWLTILMGPGTNCLLLSAAAIFWDRLVRIFDSNVVFLWMIFNALYLLTNLIPYQSRRPGVSLRTDGFQLLQIPFRKGTELAIYLSTTALIGAMQLFNDQDYEGARRACLQGLERLPQDPMLSIILSACHINLGDYESGRAVLEPLSDPSMALSPEFRAPIENNLALALWLRDCNTDQRDKTLPRADALQDHAYKTYPCVLAYRTSRALLLVATNRSDDALALLEYLNYAKGSQDDRANQHIARAFALGRLNRNEEAEQALAAGLKLTKKRLPWLTTIGLCSS